MLLRSFIHALARSLNITTTPIQQWSQPYCQTRVISAKCYYFILSLFTQTCQSQLSIFFQTNETSNQLSLSQQHPTPSPEGEDGVHGRLLAERKHHLLTLWRQTLQLLQRWCHSRRRGGAGARHWAGERWGVGRHRAGWWGGACALECCLLLLRGSVGDGEGVVGHQHSSWCWHRDEATAEGTYGRLVCFVVS